MSTSALVFMVLSWSLVLGLMGWSFGRILNPRRAPPPREDGRS